MPCTVENYREGVAMSVGVALGITLDEAIVKLEADKKLVDAWHKSGVPFTDTAAFLVTELNHRK